MYLLLTDETNRQPSTNTRFFIYGGLFFDLVQLPKLDQKIAQIRRRAGYVPTDPFKFNTKSRPKQVATEAHTAAKRELLLACQELDCRFIVNLTHHEIAKNQNQKIQVMWAANRMIGRFNHFLSRYVGDDGICVVDNLPKDTQWNYLREKHTRGLVLPDRETPLDRIRLFAASTINASHVMSAVDVVLGAFRYCVNNPQNVDAARLMMRDVVRLIWHQKVGDTYHLIGRGWIQSPKNLDEYPTFKPEYDKLAQHINGLLENVEGDEDSSE